MRWGAINYLLLLLLLLHWNGLGGQPDFVKSLPLDAVPTVFADEIIICCDQLVLRVCVCVFPPSRLNDQRRKKRIQLTDMVLIGYSISLQHRIQ